MKKKFVWPPSKVWHKVPFNGHVPVWLVEIVRKALAKHPDLRFQTAAEFAQALKDTHAPALLKPVMAPTILVVSGERFS